MCVLVVVVASAVAACAHRSLEFGAAVNSILSAFYCLVSSASMRSSSTLGSTRVGRFRDSKDVIAAKQVFYHHRLACGDII